MNKVQFRISAEQIAIDEQPLKVISVRGGPLPDVQVQLTAAFINFDPEKGPTHVGTLDADHFPYAVVPEVAVSSQSEDLNLEHAAMLMEGVATGLASRGFPVEIVPVELIQD